MLFSFDKIKRSFSKITSIPVLLGEDSPITRIRIWKSGYFTDSTPEKTFIHTNAVKSMVAPILKGKQSNIGHVSVETREIYASLWPEGITLFNKYKPQQDMNNINY